MSIPVRLGLFYAAIFIGNGANTPYIPVWFHHRGLTGAEIGLILSAPMLARVVTAPAIAMWADAFKLRRTPMLLLGLLMAGTFALLIPPWGFVWWFMVWFVASSALASIPPLTDVMVLARARTDGFNYGWPRGMGSAGFIAGNLGMGALLVGHSPELVLAWIIGAALLAAFGARYLLPPDPVLTEGEVTPLRERWAGLGDLLKDRDFVLVVVSAGLIQAAHAFYYAFSTLAWKQQGVPESLMGLLWSIGVVVEIAFLWWMEPWRRRMGPRNLLMLGALAALIRWTVLAFSPPLWLVFLVQSLHALSYAATFVASLQLVERLSTPKNASGAQLINSALQGGVLSGLATMGSGVLFDHFGAKGYLAMTAMTLLGLIGALRLYGVKRLDG